MRRRLALIALAASAVAAQAAELPTRHAKSRPDDKAQACEIDGQRGVELPGGGCMKIGGYVGVGASAGNIKH